MTAMMALLPLLLTLLVTLATFAGGLKRWTEMTSSCRISVLDGQAEMARLLIELESLNPQARSLQQARAVADQALAAARASKVAPAIAAAALHQRLVMGVQRRLRMKQEMLLARARGVPPGTPIKARRLARSLAVRLGPRPWSGLAVRPVPANSDSPEFLPVPNFTQAQALQLKFQVDLLSEVPSWLKQWIGPKATLSSHCEATLNKEKNLWQAQLSADKS